MATVNVCCAIRQGSSYVRAFLNQVESLLRKHYDLGVVVIVVDGEAVVDPALLEARPNLRVDIVLEGPRSPPTFDIEERAAAWSRVGNLALERSLHTPSDYTLWVESDLCFPCDIVDLLIESAQDIVAPLIMRGDTFYDSWGFRDLNGKRVWNLADFWALPRGPGSLVELSSVGSCLLVRSEILVAGVRTPGGYESGMLVGFCLEARRRGWRVFCRPDAVILHPTSLWAEQVSRIVACRVGDAQEWMDVNPSSETIVAAPFDRFVVPQALSILRQSGRSLPKRITVAFASNPRREIAVLVGSDGTMPPVPDGYGPTSPARSVDIPTVGPIRRLASRVKRTLRRMVGLRLP